MSDEQSKKPVLPQVYTLTSLTRSSGQSRRVVLAGFDVPLRGFVVTLVASIASIPAVSIAWLFLGSMSLVFTLLFIVAAFVLVEGRSKRGLQLRMYQSIIDQKRENVGRFICCGMEVRPGRTQISLIVPSALDNRHSKSRLMSVDDVLNIDGISEPAEIGPGFQIVPASKVKKESKRRKKRQRTELDDVDVLADLPT